MYDLKNNVNYNYKSRTEMYLRKNTQLSQIKSIRSRKWLKKPRFYQFTSMKFLITISPSIVASFL